MILRVCCKCGRWLGPKFGGWFHPWISKSHAYCPKCHKEELDALRNLG